MSSRLRLSVLVSLAFAGLALGVPSDAPTGLAGALAFPDGGPAWQSGGGLVGAHYGSSLASAGDVNGDGFDDLIVGAPGYDSPSTPNTHEGRAFVYLGSALGPATQPVWTADGAQLGFGTSVASAGDVNGDGYDDIIVGEPDATLGPAGQPPQWGGQASLFLGSSSGPSSTPAWVGHAGLFDRFGASVASAGDVNGDGYGDVIVGAPADATRPQGHAFLYLGSPGGLSATPAWSAASGPPWGGFGAAVAGAGDVNGDGFDDVLVGEPNFQGAGFSLGRAFVYLGSAQGLSATPEWTRVGDGFYPNSTFFGCTLTAGQFNGDAFSDIVVGCAYRGSMLFLGSASGPQTSPAWYAGGALAKNAGDVNGDHFDDLVTGDPGYANGQSTEGAASIYEGGPAGLSTAPGWAMEGNQAAGNFGAAVAGAGDTDGDGLANVLVGAPGYDFGQADEGGAFLFFGPVVVPCAVDGDGDGYCASGAGADCNDADPSIHPNAIEACNGIDDNCNGFVDEDSDQDGVADCIDNCRIIANADQTDTDHDGLGDACDNCPTIWNPDQNPDACLELVRNIFISFSSDVGKGSGTIVWDTSAEVTLSGFNVVLLDAKRGREQINPALIPCRECTNGIGTSYSYIIPKHKSGQSFFLEYVHIDGSVETFGPAVRR